MDSIKPLYRKCLTLTLIYIILSIQIQFPDSAMSKATRKRIFSVPEKTEGLSLVSNFWYQLDESFCSGTRSCDCAGEIRVMVRNWGALHWVEFTITKSHSLSTLRMQGPVVFLNIKGKMKMMRASWGSCGTRRQMTVCSKMSMPWLQRFWKLAQCS